MKLKIEETSVMGTVRFSAVMGAVIFATAIAAVFGCSPKAIQDNDVLTLISKATGIFGCRGCNQSNLEEIATELIGNLDEADANDDGLLSLAEAQAIISGLTEEEFATLDINGDGFLDEDELNLAANPDEPVEGEGEPPEDEGEQEGEATEGPKAAFTMNFTSGEAPLIVQFEDQSTAGSSAITSWSWEFGDPDSDTANSDTFQNPVHTFNTEGTYSISLTVTTAHGSDSISHDVTVLPGQGEIVSQDVRVVDDINTLSLDTDSGDDYTFVYTGNGVPPVEPGDILVGTEGDGYLRRVSAVKSVVTKANGMKSVAINTEFCSLDEVVEEGSLELDEPIAFTADDFAKSGIKIAKAGTTLLDLSGKKIYDEDGITVTITKGTVDFAPSMDVEVELKLLRPVYAKAAATAEFTLDFDARVDAGAGSFDTSDLVPIHLMPTIKIRFTGMVGPIPITGTVKLSFVGGVRLQLENKVTLEGGFDSTTTITIGGEYDRDYEPPLRNLSSLKLEADAYGPEWTIEAGGWARVYVRPQLEVAFYGVAAPFLGLEPYAQAELQLAPPPLYAELTAGLDAYLGFKLGILSVEELTKTWELTIDGPSYTLYEGTYPIETEGEQAEGEPTEGEHPEGETPFEGEVEVTPGEMVYVAAGTFEMGDPWDEGDSDEVPVHDVTLSAYEIGKYEVTNQEYADILNWGNSQGYLTTASTTTADAYGVQLLEVDDEDCQITWSGSAFVVDTRDGYSMADHPVVEVTWYGAAVYCNWLSESQGLTACYNTSTWTCNFSNSGYHLPTEAQWERAAAWDGTQHYRYGNGSDSISSSNVNYNNNNPLGLSGSPYTSPVGYYAGVTSPVGCYDMSGNVWEWCNDRWKREYTTSSVIDPTGPSSGSYRLLRGGSWNYHVVTFCRSAYRYNRPPAYTSLSHGFRISRTP